jgi:hypothetical protein
MMSEIPSSLKYGIYHKLFSFTALLLPKYSPTP